MKDRPVIDDWALHAYVDGEISGEQKAEIEAMLRDDPEAAERVAAWRQQREALKQSFEGVLTESLPPSLSAALHRGGSRPSRPYLATAAALLLLMTGGFAGWFFAQVSEPPQAVRIAERALVAHAVYAVEVRHPVEVHAAEQDHLRAWLSKRIGNSFVIPDLTPQGYRLLGGRLLAAADRPAAQLMYEDLAGHRITIFLVSEPTNAETALHVEQRGPLIACYWLDGNLGFAVAGEMEREAMMKLAHVIYEQFEG